MIRRAGAVRGQGDLVASSRATSGMPEPWGPCMSLRCVPAGSTHSLSPQCSSAMAYRVPPSSVPRHSVVGARGDGSSWPDVSQTGLPVGSILIPLPHTAPLHVRAEWDHSHLGDGSQEEDPILGVQQDGAPSRVAACPLSWLTAAAGGAISCAAGAPRVVHLGCTSGVQLLVPPRPPPWPEHLGLWVPVAPAGTAPGQPPAPCLNPEGPGWARGLPGLQMVPRSWRPAQAPRDHGRHAWLGLGGGGEGCPGGVWRGHFPAQTDGAGLELQFPKGRRWIWCGVSTRRQRDSTDALGWGGGGDPVGHHGCVTGDTSFPGPEWS